MGGSRLKKKSLTAVATAFTAMSSSSMSTLWSSSNFWGRFKKLVFGRDLRPKTKKGDTLIYKLLGLIL
jgi:hypothetical protein